MCLAVPMLITAISEDGSEAVVALEGASRRVSLALVDDCAVGDYVVVHVGFALSRLEPEEAAETLALLQELAQAGENQPAEALAPPAPMGG